MSDSFIYLFGCCVFYWVAGNGDSLRDEEFYGNNLLTICLLCRVESRLPVSYKMIDMKKL